MEKLLKVHKSLLKLKDALKAWFNTKTLVKVKKKILIKIYNQINHKFNNQKTLKDF